MGDGDPDGAIVDRPGPAGSMGDGSAGPRCPTATPASARTATVPKELPATAQRLRRRRIRAPWAMTPGAVSERGGPAGVSANRVRTSSSSTGLTSLP